MPLPLATAAAGRDTGAVRVPARAGSGASW